MDSILGVNSSSLWLQFRRQRRQVLTHVNELTATGGTERRTDGRKREGKTESNKKMMASPRPTCVPSEPLDAKMSLRGKCRACVCVSPGLTIWGMLSITLHSYHHNSVSKKKLFRQIGCFSSRHSVKAPNTEPRSGKIWDITVQGVLPKVQPSKKKVPMMGTSLYFVVRADRTQHRSDGCAPSLPAIHTGCVLSAARCRTARVLRPARSHRN